MALTAPSRERFFIVWSFRTSTRPISDGFWVRQAFNPFRSGADSMVGRSSETPMSWLSKPFVTDDQ
jgi:hypothetical protein